MIFFVFVFQWGIITFQCNTYNNIIILIAEIKDKMLLQNKKMKSMIMRAHLKKIISLT